MSRLPPQIKQHINGELVPGWQVQPVIKDGVTYKIYSEHCLGDDGRAVGQDWVLEASDADSKILWRTVYYHIKFIPDLETDVQESFPVDFKINDEVIIIEHEYDDGSFHISMEGVLIEVKKPKHSSDLPPTDIISV